MSDFLTRVYPEDGSAAFGKSPLYNFDLFQNLVASSKVNRELQSLCSSQSLFNLSAFCRSI